MSTVTTGDRTEMLERKAEVVRSRLFRAVDALDTRRHQVERIGATAKAVAGPTALAVAGIAALFGVSAWAFGVALKRRRRLSVGERLAETVRDLNLANRPSFTRRAAEKVALGLISFAVTEVSRRATKNFADGRLLDGRLAVGNALTAHRLNE